MKKIYLVDVSSLFFRAYYAIPPLSNSAGLPTNALYGFASMCIRLLREEKPEYMAFCFDGPEASFREEIYEDYKANRTEMPDDLSPQMPYITEISEKLGIACVDKKTFEADDLIGTIAKMAEAEKMEVVIVSGDKDFAQLINDKICMLDTMKNVRYDVEGVIEKWGVRPDQMIDYLAMIGDSSDNIPGIRGIGPKTAQKLLAEYKTLEGVYQNIDKLKGAMKTKIEEGEDDAYMAKELVTINTKVKINKKIEDFKLKEINKEELKELFEELEFSALLKKLFADESPTKQSVPPKKLGGKKDSSKKKATSVSVGSTPKSFQKEMLSLEKVDKLVKPESEIWVSMNERGFCFASGEKAFGIDADLKDMATLLQKKNLKWNGYNLKKVWHQFELGLQKTPTWDGMLSAYVVLGKNTEDFSAIYKEILEKDFPELTSPEDELGLMIELKSELDTRLKKQNGEGIFNTLELPLVPILFEMEKHGLLLDKKVLEKQSKGLAKDIEALEKAVFKEAGESFNIGSPKQLGHILFEKMGIPPVKKTKTGYSTNSDVLEKIAHEYPIANLVMEYRELTKLKSTYVDALPNLVSDDGRLHTSFHQALTTTGRLSSSNPNLQNLPIRTERGREVRQAMIAPEGHQLISVDYSQIELRILAEITDDKGLQNAFISGKDIHSATAAEVFGVKIDDVTPEQRRMAKAVNFGIAYGQGVYGLAEALNISRAESKEIIDNYFRKFKGVRTYMSETVENAKEKGYTETLFGRRRYLPELESKNGMIRKFGERAAINAPIQGTASDLMKIAMIQVYENIEWPILLQVHDELLIEVPTDDVEDAMGEVKEIMENVAKFKVPLKASASAGPNWDAAH